MVLKQAEEGISDCIKSDGKRLPDIAKLSLELQKDTDACKAALKRAKRFLEQWRQNKEARDNLRELKALSKSRQDMYGVNVEVIT